MKRSMQPVRNPADYGYPSNDIQALSTKAAEVTRRLTERYGELPFSNKDPMSDTPLGLEEQRLLARRFP